MKFWDTSAILPLLVEEKMTALREQQLTQDPWVAVWYGTPVEIESALSRREREGLLPAAARQLADLRLAKLSRLWMEINPSAQIRARAIRALRIHPLRAGDAFQLAAALVLGGENPETLSFLTADSRLQEAARREGFPAE